jgi:hypothetical protein
LSTNLPIDRKELHLPATTFMSRTPVFYVAEQFYIIISNCFESFFLIAIPFQQKAATFMSLLRPSRPRALKHVSSNISA